MIAPAATTPKARLKKIASDAGVPLQDVLVLASQNDPFNCGGPAQVEQAEWFATNWLLRMGDERAHIRKFHYRNISQPEPILMPDGTPYQNTESCWQKLQTWSKFARYLGLIDPLQIIDNRNPAPHLFAPEPMSPALPSWEIEEWCGFNLPAINASFWTDFGMPTACAEGYTYGPGEQPCLTELWVEKSTMDEDLIPICRQLGANLVTSTGFASVTGAITTFSRAGAWAALGRPVRIFYLSDFDPAGDSMPAAVSRQLEFWHEQFGDGVDIKLTPLALTKSQVDHYSLPTIPIKESDKRQAAFKSRHGVDGAVELDALEAIYPGELARIVHEAISQYRDDDLENDLIEASITAANVVDREWNQHIAPLKLQADDLDRRAVELAEKFRPRVDELSAEFDGAMQAINDEAEKLEAAVNAVIENADLKISLPHRPTASVNAPDESNWLFSSDRTFGEQLQRYKSHKDGK